MVRVYGTAKPDVGVISRFYGPTRRDSDNALREHLLRMTIVPTLPAKLTNEPIVAGAIPDWFNGMLTVHASLQQALARTRKARRDEPVP